MPDAGRRSPRRGDDDLVLTALALRACRALLPAVLAAVNLCAPAPADARTAAAGLVSILIPARNEAGQHRRRPCGRRSPAPAMPVEMIVGDDHSTDATAEIVRGHRRSRALRSCRCRRCPRAGPARTTPAPTWPGSARGRAPAVHRRRRAPGAARPPRRLVAQARRTGAALVSAVPRQRTETLGEMLTVPMIDFLLVGYLPVPLMRRRCGPALGAACGQLILIERDGLRRHRRPRRDPRASCTTACGCRGSCAPPATAPISSPGAALATCRMYTGLLASAWAGFSKNAHEGMATPARPAGLDRAARLRPRPAAAPGPGRPVSGLVADRRPVPGGARARRSRSRPGRRSPWRSGSRWRRSRSTRPRSRWRWRSSGTCCCAASAPARRSGRAAATRWAAPEARQPEDLEVMNL